MKIILKKLSILVLALILSILALSLGGCSNEKDLQSEFAEYLSLDEKNDTYSMSSKTEVSLFTFEKTDDVSPKFCIEFNIEHKPLYDWLKLSDTTRKADLKAVAVLAQGFIVSKDWSNKSQIYISVIYEPGTQAIYDLTKDKLYVPNSDSLFIRMYETYSTCSLSKVREMPSGPDWLEHNNISSSSDLESMWVYIINGELKISDEQKSTAV